ncbi:hypothetical protein QFZ24_002539 [Streptomyces phaeochromogenes]|uniref:hypothetical protein n=1 Tax=Streptomyces phaeochromogenes TaxID=1923 RepID=UPI00278D0759|nr:hypothetical protein [Streptomyces phaeochromogenes]MDQ0948616.1 hypothetical protein [Streptomyces phaeochromogenes]
MTSPEAIAARALAQAALKMAQAAANPTVMVKHGRREDRAAAYDRFIGACAAFYRDRDPSGVNDLYAALHAVELRAPRLVREAAANLCSRIVGDWVDPETLHTWSIPVGDHHPSVAPYLVDEVKLVPVEEIPPPPPGAGDTMVIANPLELREELSDFIEKARSDVNRRWWHWMVVGTNGDRGWWKWLMARIPPLKRWWGAR